MRILANLDFNIAPAYFMHIDLNSCFATIEQQANPLLRYKPIAVAAYDSPKGIILAPSVEAKRLGIKLGFRVEEAKKICPQIVILTPDPNKYRYIHHQLKKLLLEYTDDVVPKSVDEFVLNFENTPKYKLGLMNIGAEIKKRIKDEVGDYITVSIGISKNKFLAKMASNLKKPDGLEEINEHNYLEIYKNLTLIDITGIGEKSAVRLNSHDIFTMLDFYNSPSYKLKTVFESVVGHYWYLKLRGYEIENYKDQRKSFGHQYALPKPMTTLGEIKPILIKLVEKMGLRLRNSGYKTQGLCLYLVYRDHTSWHQSRKTKRIIFDSRDIYKEIINLFNLSPRKPIRLLGISCFNLVSVATVQLGLFEDVKKSENLTHMLDKINNRWGRFVIAPASMLSKEKYVPDRIGFGSV